MIRRDVAILLLGAGLGAALALIARPDRGAAPDVGDAAETVALRDRVAGLERALASRPLPLAAPPLAAAPAPSDEPTHPESSPAAAPASAEEARSDVLPHVGFSPRASILRHLEENVMAPFLRARPETPESEASRAEREAETQRLKEIEDAISEASRKATEAIRGDLIAFAAQTTQANLAAKALARAATLKDRAHSAFQATGAPDTPIAGDHGTAWAPKHPQGGLVTLELGYARAVRVDGVRIRETLAPGAVVAVAARAPDGSWITIWEGGASQADAPRWFEPPVTATTFATDRLRLTLDTDRVAGWNEIDAVELIGDGWRQWASEASASSSYAD